LWENPLWEFQGKKENIEEEIPRQAERREGVVTDKPEQVEKRRDPRACPASICWSSPILCNYG
jgi:hypothetical protein